jgi:hypothetical protein
VQNWSDDAIDAHRRMSPPENEIPVVLSRAVLLARTADAALALTAIRVYSTGLYLELSVRVRPASRPAGDVHELLWRHGPGAPAVLFGVELADGTRLDNVGRSSAAHVVFQHAGGSGGGSSAEQSWWLHPLPPTGPLRFVVRSDELGIDETAVELDGAEVHRAAEDVVSLWPWEMPAEFRLDPPPPPDLPAGSWFAGG